MPQIASRERDITLEDKVLSYPDRARRLTIDTPGDYTAAGEFVKVVDGLVKEVEGTFRPLIDEAHRHHKSLIAEMNRHLTPLQTAKTMARTLMVSWDRKQAEIARQREIELTRMAREVETEAKIQEALAAEAAGHQEEAQAILEEEVYVPPIIVQKDVPKVAGVVFKTIWKFRVVDPGSIPREYLTPDLVKIGQVVRALRGSSQIPGVEAYEERV